MRVRGREVAMPSGRSGEEHGRAAHPMSAIEQQMHEDLLWAVNNRSVQQQYAGQLVVVHRKQVIASGTDEKELLRCATGPGRPREELVVVEILSDTFEIPPDTLDILPS